MLTLATYNNALTFRTACMNVVMMNYIALPYVVFITIYNKVLKPNKLTHPYIHIQKGK